MSGLLDMPEESLGLLRKQLTSPHSHRYRCEMAAADLVILVCECGDVLWKDRPKNA